jgi:hypothetical protein
LKPIKYMGLMGVLGQRIVDFVADQEM